MPKSRSQRATSASSTAGSWHTAFFDALPDAILVCDASNGRIVAANPAALRLFNSPSDALIGQHFSHLIPIDTVDESTPLARCFPLTGQLAEAQTWVASDGTPLLCDVVGMTIPDGDRSLAALHLRDLRARQTRLSALSDALEAGIAERVNRTVDHYMSYFSHELKTPLAVILSSSSMLESYYARLSEHKRAEHFTRIQLQVRYLTDLLDNLRFLCLLDSGQVSTQREHYHAGTHLQEIIHSYGGHAQRPQFEVAADERAQTLYMDGRLWRRIVCQLISNAVKYGSYGGTIQIMVKKRPDGMLETQVRDYGPGLPPGFEIRDFNLSQNDRPEGGLGLMIASRCALLAGGQLSYEANGDAGTTFTVVIPAD